MAEDPVHDGWIGEEGEDPHCLAARAEQGIDQVEEAVRNYPWPTTYDAFPGPNSNTFTAWIAKEVPDLKLDLPFSAIGSGYND